VLEVKKTGDKYTLNTDDVNLLIHSVTQFAKSRNIKIIALNTLNPSLEEVFMELIGRA